MLAKREGLGLTQPRAPSERERTRVQPVSGELIAPGRQPPGDPPRGERGGRAGTACSPCSLSLCGVCSEAEERLWLLDAMDCGMRNSEANRQGPSNVPRRWGDVDTGANTDQACNAVAPSVSPEGAAAPPCVWAQ